VLSFSEILLLSTSSYGIGAMKLVRTMYEEAVTASYLHRHPDQASDYLAFGRMQQYKVGRRVNEEFGDSVLSQETLAVLKERRDEVRPKFVVELCKTCHTTGDNYRWSMLDFVSLAREAGPIGELVLVGYSIPLLEHHGNVTALLSRLEESASGIVYDPGPKRPESSQALMTAHHILLFMIELQKEHFKLDDLSERIERCVEDFKDIWLARCLARSDTNSVAEKPPTGA
jgi:hypothetical protein